MKWTKIPYSSSLLGCSSFPCGRWMLWLQQ
jgi:hypothetical protein